MYLVFDTETTGLPINSNAPISDLENWPRMVQIAWQLHDELGNVIDNQDYIIKPEGYDIPFKATAIHGITTEMAIQEGHDLEEILKAFNQVLTQAKVIVGHNIKFDIPIVGAEMYRKELSTPLAEMPLADTTEFGKEVTKLQGGRGGQFKYPKLDELYTHLFQENFMEAHNAAADVNATARCFFELMRIEAIPLENLQLDTLQFQNFLQKFPSTVGTFDIKIRRQVAALNDHTKATGGNWKNIELGSYFHFHNHTVYSRLQSTTHFSELIATAEKNQFTAVSMVDFGNMMGAFKFINEVEDYNDKITKAKKEVENGNTDEELKKTAQKNILKPILGCEFYISERYTQKQFTKDDPDRVTQMVLLAKNKEGFQNLSKISSEGFINGFYNAIPRVSKAVILENKQHLIAVTGSSNSDICHAILNFGEQYAEDIFQWWHQEFGDDFYVQIQNHGLNEELHVNSILIKWAEKYGVKTLAQNETYYTQQPDAYVQDILVCIKDGESKSTPIGRGYGKRFGLTTDAYYLQNVEEIQKTFAQYPQCFEAYHTFYEKFEPYSLKRPILLPKFDIPEQFVHPEDDTDGGKRGEMAYLRHLTYEGAAIKYPEMTTEIRERLDFELEIIAKTGYPGYFLIVQDFCNQAKKMGVSVGPGRGSAAGSAVAYCTGITNVDPIKYDLLFERFLNPERVSMPDIDIDFDDEGRGKIIDWVVEKYGQSQVAQIITYSTLGGKSAIKDAGRVLEYPLQDTNILSNLLPATPGFNLKKAFESDEKKLKEKYKLDADGLDRIKKLKGFLTQNGKEHDVVDSAYKMEGGLRGTGIHACGVIITPEDIRNLVPVSNAKDSNLFVSQFDNSVVESAGLLKMDFLGLKTLTIIKNAVKLIKNRFDLDIDVDHLPLDDEKTYQLFKDGKTVGIFQYESAGMQKHLRDLQPDKFDDLIAMNALYRPGPLQYIPNFVARKHGREPIVYDLPEMEEYLSDTYGITVYQEQVMLLSQKLANFTKGEADTLRKAMGKKQRAVLDKMFPKFMEGGKTNQLDENQLQKIWKDWEAFAEYAFNKSHSTCYAWIAYQTAYLKANYPAEFMAAVLNNANAIEKIAFFMEECKYIGVPVLGPDVNESDINFTVTKDGVIRFGLSYIKGVGEKAVANLIEERNKNGLYTDIYDFAQRNARTSVNKKAYEQFAMSGAFDSFGFARSQYFFTVETQRMNQIERLIKYGNDFQNQKESNQFSLFGGSSDMDIASPHFQEIPEWELLEKLKNEKDTIGIFLTGHPLDLFKYEMQNFCNFSVKDINNALNQQSESDNGNTDEDGEENTMDNVAENTINLDQLKNKEICIGGVVNGFQERQTKNGDPYGQFIIADFSGAMEFRIFKKDYTDFKKYLGNEYFLFIKGKVVEHRFIPDKWEFNIQQIQFLSDLREQKIKKIEIFVEIHQINDEMIEGIESLIKANIARNQKTTCQLAFQIFDQEGNQIQMLSRNAKIFPDDEFLNKIKEELNLVYTLN